MNTQNQEEPSRSRTRIEWEDIDYPTRDRLFQAYKVARAPNPTIEGFQNYVISDGEFWKTNITDIAEYEKYVKNTHFRATHQIGNGWAAIAHFKMALWGNIYDFLAAQDSNGVFIHWVLEHSFPQDEESENSYEYTRREEHSKEISGIRNARSERYGGFWHHDPFDPFPSKEEERNYNKDFDEVRPSSEPERENQSLTS